MLQQHPELLTGCAFNININFIAFAAPNMAQQLKRRVAAELKTTFASHYAGELSLAETLQPEWIAVYSRRSTGSKYLINPNKALN